MRAALAALPGVRQVQVDFETQQAVVTVEQSSYDEQKLIKALEEAGFGGSIKRAERAGEPERPQPGIPADEEPNTLERVTYRPASFGKHVEVNAYLDRDILRPGDSFRVAVVLDVDKSWHIYGNPLGPGVGQLTEISAAAPDGFRFDPARYAPGEKYEQDFGDAGKTWVWVHTGRVIHYLSGIVSESTRPGEYVWMIEAKAQVCDPDSCLPGRAVVRLPVTVDATAGSSEPIHADLFKGFDQAREPLGDESTD